MTFYRLPFSTVSAINVIPNPSFELPADTYGWEIGADASDFFTTARFDASGQQVLAWGGASGNPSIKTVEITPTIPPGSSATYYYRFKIRKQNSGNSATQAQVKVEFYNSGGTLIGAPSWSTVSGTLSTSWLNVSGSVSPGAAFSFVFNVRAVSANGTGGFEIDEVYVGAQNVSAYFDGDTANTFSSGSGTFHYWDTVRGVSESFKTASVSGDLLTADVDVTLPLRVTRETRSVVSELLDSDEVRVTYVPPGPRTGEFVAVFASPAAAVAAQEWFAEGALFYHRDSGSTSHADMLFTVAKGGIEVSQEQHNGVELRIPFVEKR